MGSVARITGAGFDFSVAGSGLLLLLALLPLPGLGAGFSEGSESDESSLAVPDFGFGFDPDFDPDFGPDFGPESDRVARADLIALSQDGCKDSLGSLLCCPVRTARGSGTAAARALLAGMDIRTRPGVHAARQQEVHYLSARWCELRDVILLQDEFVCPILVPGITAASSFIA